MPYKEDESHEPMKAQQYADISKYLSLLGDQADAAREKKWTLPAGISLENYADYIAPFREQVLEMLMYPPPGTPVEPRLNVQEIGNDEDGTFYRVRMPLLKEGLDAYGLLIHPHPSHAVHGRHLAVGIHGGGGTPEGAAGVTESYNYHDMGRQLVRRGHTVWMPACPENFVNPAKDSKENRASDRTIVVEEETETVDVHRALERKVRIVGSTLSAIDASIILTSTKAILESKYCKADAAIAVGLSYGGYRSLMTTAISDLFVACISSCYFNNHRSVLEQWLESGHLGDWFYTNALNIATDTEWAYLICPRPLCIELGISDETFLTPTAIPEAEKVRQRYEALGVADRFVFDTFEGGHEFSGIKGFELLEKMGL